MKPSRETEKEAALLAAGNGRIDILKYFVEERKIADAVKSRLRGQRCSVWPSRLPQILSRRGESASSPLEIHRFRSVLREHPDCENYLLEKGCSRTNGRTIRCFCRERASARVSGGEQFPLRSSFDCSTKRERAHIFHQLCAHTTRNSSNKKSLDTTNEVYHEHVLFPRREEDEMQKWCF